MHIKTKFVTSFIASTGLLFASFLLPIIPCRSAPSIPNPVYKWGLCNLNPEVYRSLSALREYWGYTSDLTSAYFLTFFIFFIVFMLVFHFFVGSKSKKK